VRLHEGLVELDCGDWEGREKAEVGRKVSKLAADERVPGGESAADAWARLQAFLADAGLAERGHDPVVVVGHHLVNKLLRAALVGEPVEGALASPLYRPALGSVVLLDRATGALTPAPSAVAS
jgi:broad specificity phosphatase PhoE